MKQQTSRLILIIVLGTLIFAVGYQIYSSIRNRQVSTKSLESSPRVLSERVISVAKLQSVADRTKIALRVQPSSQSMRDKHTEATFLVEVVNTPESITRGLSGRNQLGADGMLFVLPQRYRPTFWMKEMQFDLDLVWIDRGQIVEITPNVPHQDPDLPLNQLPLYTPNQVVEMVLEVPAGTSREMGLEVGAYLEVVENKLDVVLDG